MSANYFALALPNLAHLSLLIVKRVRRLALEK